MILNSNKPLRQKWDMLVQLLREMKTDSLISLNTLSKKTSAPLTGVGQSEWLPGLSIIDIGRKI